MQIERALKFSFKKQISEYLFICRGFDERGDSFIVLLIIIRTLKNWIRTIYFWTVLQIKAYQLRVRYKTIHECYLLTDYYDMGQLEIQVL